MKLTAIVLFLLILAPSCTVEKRLHNRGWNIQWKKHHKVSKAQKSENDVSQNSQIGVDQIEKEPLESGKTSIESTIKNCTARIELNETTKNNLLDMNSVHNQNPESLKENNFKLVSKVVQNFGDQYLVPNASKSKEKAEGSRKIGRIFLTLGIILIALFFLLPALSAVASFNLIDGVLVLGLMVLCIAFGFIFMIIGASMIKKSKKTSS